MGLGLILLSETAGTLTNACEHWNITALGLQALSVPDELHTEHVQWG